MASAMDLVWYGDDVRECKGCGDWVKRNTRWTGLCRKCREEALELHEANPATTAPRLLIPAEPAPADSASSSVRP